MLRRFDQGQPIQTVHFKFPPFLNPQQEGGNINKMSTNLAGGMRKTTAIPTQETNKHLQT